MKKTALYTALYVLSCPASIHALGLGEMKVQSALDQPFSAEIELIDSSGVPLTSVKAGMANPQNFERLGIAPVDTLSDFLFEIKRNPQGRLVVKIHSQERMSEPFIQLLVDLAWPKGQLYKAYTVLLDPPGYRLVASNVHSSSTNHRKVVQHKVEQPIASNTSSGKTTYGPIITNENVWQIAQRYKADDIILPQVVLAIVGQNPDAFNDGNLNGIKVGATLVIPSSAAMSSVPADLATVEAMAHDKAWNEKTTINHVLSPPYRNGKPSTEIPVASSQIPPVPQFSITAAPTMQKPISAEQDASLKAEISISSAVVDSLRESNSMFIEQLHLMQVENKKLHGQLDARDKEIQSMRTQFKVLERERVAVAALASSVASSHSSSMWTWFLLFMAGGGVFWHFKRRISKTEGLLKPIVSEEEPLISPTEAVEDSPLDNLLEFEPGLHELPSEDVSVPSARKGA